MHASAPAAYGTGTVEEFDKRDHPSLTDVFFTSNVKFFLGFYLFFTYKQN